MSLPILHVNAFLYGANGVRIEADLGIPINPPSLAKDLPKLQVFATEQLARAVYDLKHSHAMPCEICGALDHRRLRYGVTKC